jgi:Rps23 Pro-64 3,4-dihydroxylase Tpa1-like proline 4-hydroxylase
MFQIWLFHNVSDINLTKIYNKITKYFFDLDESEQLNVEISSTLYNDRCFLHDHIDGKSPVKNYASILIYLNENWNGEDGGNLILKGDDGIEYKVVPEFGRVAMIDLQNFDIYHAVEKVINNKERYCLISFPFNKKNKQ